MSASHRTPRGKETTAPDEFELETDTPKGAQPGVGSTEAPGQPETPTSYATLDPALAARLDAIQAEQAKQRRFRQEQRERIRCERVEFEARIRLERLQIEERLRMERELAEERRRQDREFLERPKRSQLEMTVVISYMSTGFGVLASYLKGIGMPLLPTFPTTMLPGLRSYSR